MGTTRSRQLLTTNPLVSTGGTADSGCHRCIETTPKTKDTRRSRRRLPIQRGDFLPAVLAGVPARARDPDRPPDQAGSRVPVVAVGWWSRDLGGASGGGTGRWRVARAGRLVLVLLGIAVASLSGCSSTGTKDWEADSGYTDIADATPQVEPKSKYGNPASYVVFGKRYYTKASSEGHVERGVASWYGKNFHGRRTSSGERYDMYAMTAAHKTLPLPTYARVTNVDNGRSAVVKINDRGPFYGERIIDLSYSAARKLGVVAEGTAMVEVRAIDPRHPDSQPGRESEDLFLAAADRPEKKKTSASRGAATARKAPRSTPARKEPAVQIASAAGSGGQHAKPAPEPPAPPKPAPGAVESPPAAPPAPEQVQIAAAEGGEQAVAAQEAKAAPGGETSGKPASRGTYLQVGAFGNRLNAEQLRRQLVSHVAEQVQILTTSDREPPLYKVHVGPLPSKKSASDLSMKLASLGLEGSRIVVQ